MNDVMELVKQMQFCEQAKTFPKRKREDNDLEPDDHVVVSAKHEHASAVTCTDQVAVTCTDLVVYSGPGPFAYY